MKIRKTYLLDEGLIEIMQKIKQDNHYNSETAVVIEAVMSLHRKLNPSYVASRSAGSGRTPEERAKMQMDIAEHKKKTAEDKLLAIAEKLGGEILVDGNGDKYVKYYTYDKKNRYEQQLTLEMMNEELVASQYFPSKEDVLERQKKGEVNY
jgi:hypothetical protein